MNINLLTSLAIIFLSTLLVTLIMNKIHLPSLLGMLIIGIIIGPHVLNWISSSLINLSSDLREIALIIILTHAGLTLNVKELKKTGRSSILMCFLPAIFEILGYVIFAPIILHISIIESAIMGCVMAAVSPAVIVPRMIKLTKEKYGVEKGIPQMLNVATSVDDVFVIVLFSAFLDILVSGSFSYSIIWSVPISIITGIIIGICFGYIFSYFFEMYHIRDSIKVIIFISFSFIFVALENPYYSPLLSVIGMGAIFFYKAPKRAERIAKKYDKLWIVAEIFLFVLVGSAIDLNYAIESLGTGLLIILITLIIRVIGVYVCVIGTNLNYKERLFCMISYIPKATVQAAIGSIPFSLDLPCGQIILTISILSILITAPLGAVFVDLTYKKLLSNKN